MSLTRFLMLRLCIVCLPPTLWELSAIKLLRDKKLFFYFRVTISLNNAKTLGGVAEGLQRVGTQSWIKLYIVIAAGEACSSSKCFVSLSHPITFGKQLWNTEESWPRIKREIGPGEISTHQAGNVARTGQLQDDPLWFVGVEHSLLSFQKWKWH